MKPESILYNDLRESYENIISLVAAIASDFEALLIEVNEESLISKSGYGPKTFQTFRERADSELLSIAFFGAFSSGKSFLISGLNKKIEWFESQGKGQYAPLLPSSPRQTSNCPVAVEPLPADQKEDTFMVTFEGSESWEQRSPAAAPIIQAYVTDLPNAKAQRLMNIDRTREVVKAKLGIASATVKARLYDMPGFGAIGANYESVIRSLVQQADCIVYIAWAVRTLEERDLELLRDLYNHHKDTGKPVFFVLTQIDRARDIGSSSGRIEWQDVLEANNSFLEDNFLTPDGKPDAMFIGKGFIPVSPALEAKGLSPMHKPEVSKSLIDESNMNALREHFNNYLQSTSGPMHLAELVSEIQRLLKRLAQDVWQREESESIPLDEARKAIKAYQTQRSTLIAGKTTIGDELLQLGQAAISRAFAGSDPDNLSVLLLDRLESKIRSLNVLNEKVIHELETEKSTIVREWVSRNAQALIPRWVEAWNAFTRQSSVQLTDLLSQAATLQHEMMQQGKGGNEADMAATNVEDRLVGKYDDANAENISATVDVISTTWKTWTVIASLGATGIISSAIPAIAVVGISTAGIGLIATAMVGATYGRWRLSKKRKEREEMMLRELPEYSQQVVNSYKNQAEEFIRTHVGLLIEVVDNEIDRLTNSINSLEQRLLTGEYEDRKQRLTILRRLAQQCIETDSKIDGFYGAVSIIQPSLSAILDATSR